MNHAQTLLCAKRPFPSIPDSAASSGAACCPQLRGLGEDRLFRGLYVAVFQNQSIAGVIRTASPRGSCLKNLCTNTCAQEPRQA